MDIPGSTNLDGQCRCGPPSSAAGFRPAALAAALSAVLSCVLASAVYGQNPTPGWNSELAPGEEPGTVEVSTNRLNLRPGESVSYSLRLTRQPPADADKDWWVMVHIDGSTRMDGYDTDDDGDVDIRMTPSLGHEFDRNNWNKWRTITIYAADDAKLDNTLYFDHEVRDHTGNCPVHGVGVLAVGMGGPDTRISVSFDRSSYQATEGGDPATVTVVLSPAPQSRVVIPIDTSGLDNASSSDYSVDPSNVTFQGGQTRQSFTVTAEDDDVDDDDERVELSFGSLPPGFRDGSRAQATVNLIDDDDPEVSVSFDESSYQIAEGGAAATVVVVLSDDPERTVTILMDTSHSGGASPADYRGIPPSVTFRSGETRKSFTVTAADDAVDDDGESVRMSFGTLPDDRVSSGSPSQATVTITDDDERGVEVSPTTLQIDEGSTGTYTVVLTSQPTEDVTVTVGGESGDVAVESPAGKVLTFRPDSWSRRQTVRVRAAEDTDLTADPPVTLTNAVGGGDYAGESAGSVTVTVIEDDATTLSVSDVRASESVGDMVFTVTISKSNANEVTVAYATSNGTASADDYTGQSGTLTFPANSRTSQTIRVPISGDRVDEEDETFTLTLSNPDPQGVLLVGGGSSLAVTGTIVDDDTRGVRMSRTALTVRPGATGTYTVVLTSEPTSSVTVTISGHSGTDLSVDPTTPLTFTTDDWQTAQRVTVTADEEAAVGPVVLRHAVGGGDYNNVSASDVSVTISTSGGDGGGFVRGSLIGSGGDSGEPAARFSGKVVHASLDADGYKVAEGESVTIAVRLNSTPERKVEIGLGVRHQKGIGSADYSGVPESLTFGADETERSFEFTAARDDVADAGERVLLSLGGLPPGVLPGAPFRATVEILDRPPASNYVSFDQAEYEVSEGDSVQVTVSLAPAPEEAVEIPLTAEPGMGAEAADYSGIPESVTFAPGEREQSFYLKAAADEEDDGGETVGLGFGTLPDAVGASGPATSTVTLQDPEEIPVDEVGISFLRARSEASEGDESVEFIIRLGTASDREVTVDFATSAGTAAAGADYEDTTGTLRFPAGTTELSLQVPVIDDDADEAEETFTVTLSDPSNATIGVGEATGVIEDDDLPVVSISAADSSVAEGETVTFALTRAGDLTGPLEVSVEVTQAGDFLAEEPPASATFAADDSTVTLSLATVDDAVDEPDGSVSATLAAGDSHRAGDGAAATTAVTDDDERGLVVTPASLTIEEGESDSFAVVLTSEPTSDVTVVLEWPGDADVTADMTELIFTPESWDQPQSVTVTAAQDDDAVADEAELTLSVGGGDYEGLSAPSLEVSITEDDSRGVSVSSATLIISEGSSGTYTVVMDSEPTGEVTVVVEVPEGSDLTLSPTELTFTPESWREPQTVTATALADDDAVPDDPVVLTHTASGGDYLEVSGDGIEVSITETDTPGVSFSVDAMTVPEGGTGSYTVVLDSKPTGEVTVSVEVPAGAEVSVDVTGLTFTPENWSEPRTVTVTAAEDEDAVVDDPVTLKHTVSGGDYDGLSVDDVEVSISEGDRQGVSLSTMALTVAEGASEGYTIVLDSEPAGEVTVTVQVPDGAEVSVDVTELTFGPESWRQPQTVTVTAAADEDAVVDQPVVLTHAVTGGDYVGVSVSTVEVSIAERDMPLLSIADGAADESDGAMDFAVELSVASSFDVTVAYATSPGTAAEGADYEGTTGTLTFPSGTTEQSFQVTILDDEVDEAEESFTVVLREASRAGILGTGQATGVIVDDDLPVVNIEAEAERVAEGAAAPFTLTRAGDLNVPLRVAVQVEQEGDFLSGEAPAEAAFAAGEERVALAVATADDEVDEPDGWVSAEIAEAATHRIGTAAKAAVRVSDDDERGVEVTPSALRVVEGQSGTYTVALTSEPSAAVTVTVEVPDGSEVSVDESELTFTVDHWDEAQTVTVTAAQDADAVAEAAATLSHAVSGGDYDGLSAPDVEVSITEDDTPGVTVSVETLTLAEGASGSYAVVLRTEPAGEVTVTVGAPEDGDVDLSPGSLTYTAANWNQAQTVTATAAHDDDAAADAVTLTHAVSGGDYDGVAAPSVEVSITEDDVQGVVVSAAELTVAEGESVSYTVALETEPVGPVTVAVAVPAGTDLFASPAEMTFTSANWDQAQEVTVTAAEDDDAVADAAATLAHAVRGGDYDGVTAPAVVVSVTEDDAPGVTVSVASLSVAEGGTAGYEVVLETEPSGMVQVAVELPGETDLSVSPRTLTFTAADWSQPKEVTVRASQDDDAVTDPPVQVGHSASGGDYGKVAVPGVTVSVTEDDTPGVRVSVEALTLAEGERGSYRVALETEPSDTVTVAVRAPAGAEVSASPTELTFTAATWRQSQRVTVTAAEDDDAVVDPPVTLTHAVSGGDYDLVSAAGVRVSVTEDDRPALTIADAVASEEADSISFTVTLDVPSSLEVGVGWTTADGTAIEGADYEQRGGALQFAPLETAKSFAVPLVDDALHEGRESFTLSLSAPVNATLADGLATGTITDDDAAPALTIADAAAPEGDGALSFAVSLGAVSGLEVRVDWATSDGTAAAGKDYTASSGTLIIPPGGTQSTIEVAVFNDALDETEETLVVSLSRAVNADVADGAAEGTIIDDDLSLEKAWLARFGRTTATQVMDALASRLRARTRQGDYLTLGGARLSFGGPGAAARGRDSYAWMGGSGPRSRDLSFAGGLSPVHGPRRGSLIELLSRSSFLVSSGGDGEDGDGEDTEGEARWTAWGRGVTTNFEHNSPELWLKGGAITSVIGIDWHHNRMLAGLMMAHNLVMGDYDIRSADESVRRDDLDNHLASMHPYVQYALTERLSAWGVLGYGRGLMGKSTGRASRGIAMRMGGIGVRGALGTPGRLRTFDLAVRSDAFWVRMDAPETRERPEVEADVSRVRLALEGSRHFALSEGRGLSPTLDLGLRRDGGDAETGMGMEIGGGLGYTDPDRGLSMETTARRLLAHRDDGYEEWGVAGSFTFDPGVLQEGVWLDLRSFWGAASSGLDRLWGQQVPGAAPASIEAPLGGGLHAEVGYGLEALGGRLTPYAGVGLSGDGRGTCRLGWRLQGVESNLKVEVAGARRALAAAGSSHEIRLRATFDW